MNLGFRLPQNHFVYVIKRYVIDHVTRKYYKELAYILGVPFTYFPSISSTHASRLGAAADFKKQHERKEKKIKKLSKFSLISGLSI